MVQMISFKQLIQILEEIESKHDFNTHICVQLVDPRTKKVIHSNYRHMGFNKRGKTTIVNTAGIRKWCKDYVKNETTEADND